MIERPSTVFEGMDDAQACQQWVLQSEDRAKLRKLLGLPDLRASQPGATFHTLLGHWLKPELGGQSERFKHLTDELFAVAIIEMCRKINRRAAEQFRARGVTAEDAAIAAVYSAHDLAMATGRSPIEAIEWLRTALDLQERQLLEQGQRPH